MRELVVSPEWSFGASISFGQSLLRLMVGLASRDKRLGSIKVGGVSLIIALLIVAGLVPSLVLLVLVIDSKSPPLYYGFLQVVLFIIALLAFVFVGMVVDDIKGSAP